MLRLAIRQLLLALRVLVSLMLPATTSLYFTDVFTSSGSTPTYCGTGCDADFGTCDPKPDEIADTTNGLCGPEFLATCLNFGTKTCCSQYNFWYVSSS